MDNNLEIEVSVIPRMMVKSNREGLMITETNEKDFNQEIVEDVES